MRRNPLKRIGLGTLNWPYRREMLNFWEFANFLENSHFYRPRLEIHFLSHFLALDILARYVATTPPKKKASFRHVSADFQPRTLQIAPRRWVFA